MKVILLAGGFGTRLRERVPDLPKPMAPVAGYPFIEHILDHLVKYDIQDIILSVGYRAEAFISHFGYQYRNARISYSIETEPLGTGGAILYALQACKHDSVIIVNGDTLLKVDYNELLLWYQQETSPLALVLKEVDDVSRYGSVILSEGHVTGFNEKGKIGKGYINTGTYILHSHIFSDYNLAGKFSFENDLLQAHCLDLYPRAFITDAYFIDIGVPEDYERAQYELVKCLP